MTTRIDDKYLAEPFEEEKSFDFNTTENQSDHFSQFMKGEIKPDDMMF